jgi:hypothetical protein
VRDCCEELFLTFLYSFKVCHLGTAHQTGEELFFMLQAIQQQFELMKVVFNKIRDRMDRQQSLMLEGLRVSEIKYFVMLFQCMRVSYYWAGRNNLIGRPLMTGSRICILL